MLVQIDDLVVAEAEVSDISDYIHRQEEGNVLHFVIRRGEEQVEADVTVNMMETVVVNSELMEGPVGAFRLQNLQKGHRISFRKHMRGWPGQGMTRLIIDLRGMREACSPASAIR